jgi:signal transduction histidine kinase
MDHPTVGDAPDAYQLKILSEIARSDPSVVPIMNHRIRELEELVRLTSLVCSGLLLDEVLDRVYDGFESLIPFDRIGFALIEGDEVVARWARTRLDTVRLGQGYRIELAETSLEAVLEQGRPRIINDLVAYLEAKPRSETTKLIVEEGLRSSLTCPLMVDGRPLGFMFFSSAAKDTYTGLHVATFVRIAGQLAAMVEHGRLVSELEEKRNAIQKQQHDLVRIDRLKDRFLGMAAHDLRNPTASILMAADYLEASELDRDQRLFVRDISSQARYMLELIEELLDVSQIESGALELHKERVDAVDFLANEVARHSALGAAKDIRILFDPAARGVLCADPVRLRQVVDNLLSNAVKYSPKGSTVRVRISSAGDVWRLEVEDEGPGIGPEEQGKLFSYFGRLSAVPTGGESSTGLGMAITRRIVEAHGGEIGVDSKVGEGSTFWVTLPSNGECRGGAPTEAGAPERR